VTVPAPDAILTAAQVSEWLQIKPRAVQQFGIPAVKIGHRTIRYKASDVLAWIDSKRKATHEA